MKGDYESVQALLEERKEDMKAMEKHMLRNIV